MPKCGLCFNLIGDDEPTTFHNFAGLDFVVHESCENDSDEIKIVRAKAILAGQDWHRPDA